MRPEKRAGVGFGQMGALADGASDITGRIDRTTIFVDFEVDMGTG